MVSMHSTIITLDVPPVAFLGQKSQKQRVQGRGKVIATNEKRIPENRNPNFSSAKQGFQSAI